MSVLYWLDRIRPEDRRSVGDKAWQLSQLCQAGYPVGRGFAVSAAIFRDFLERLDDPASLLADFPHSSLHVNVSEFSSLQWVARQSRQAILQADWPDWWRGEIREAADRLDSPMAIARASLALPAPQLDPGAGLFAPRICPSDPLAIERAIAGLWAELLSAKSLFYWQRLGWEIDRVPLAVLVQPVYPAIASGMAEIYGDRIDLVAVRGLGLALSYGECLGDRYTLDRADGSLLSQQSGNQSRAYEVSDGAGDEGDSDCNGECNERCNDRCKTVSGDRATIRLATRPLTAAELGVPILDRAAIARLYALLQLLASPSQTGRVEWSLYPDPRSDGSPAAFLLHQWTPQPLVRLSESTDRDRPTAVPNLLQGRGVSPGTVQATACVLRSPDAPCPILPEDAILVAGTIPSHWLPALATARGIVLEQGSTTCHAAILTRELGIPAIIGASRATERLQTGDRLSIDGSSGTIYRLDSLEGNGGNRGSVVLSPSRSVSGEMRPDRLRVELMVNLSQRQSLSAALSLPVSGIGLLRSELMMVDLLAVRPLAEWLQPTHRADFVRQLADLIQSFAAAFAPRPVFYRTYDEKSPPSASLVSAGRSPIMSLSLLPQRGTYGYLLDSRLFDLELRALRRVQQAGFSNLRLVLPFVRSVEEVQFCRQRIIEADLERRSRRSLPMWMMAEVPSVAFMLPQYVEAGIEGIAIGTNDLAHLVLGTDREASFLYFSERACHPALLAVLRQLLEGARSLGIPATICGQLPVQYPSIIPDALAWGATGISVEPGAVAATYEAIVDAESRSRPSAT